MLEVSPVIETRRVTPSGVGARKRVFVGLDGGWEKPSYKTMDANKLKVLREVKYRLQKCCGLCTHGWFPKDDWGTCEAHTYEHQKHTEGNRRLSIHKYGSCHLFEAKTNLIHLGSFREFGP